MVILNQSAFSIQHRNWRIYVAGLTRQFALCWNWMANGSSISFPPIGLSVCWSWYNRFVHLFSQETVIEFERTDEKTRSSNTTKHPVFTLLWGFWHGKVICWRLRLHMNYVFFTLKKRHHGIFFTLDFSHTDNVLLRFFLYPNVFITRFARSNLVFPHWKFVSYFALYSPQFPLLRRDWTTFL